MLDELSGGDGTPAVKYPECEKVLEAREVSQDQGEFLDWILEEKGLVLAEWDTADDPETAGLVPYSFNMENLLAEFHGIDMAKVENERRAMLEEMRKAHEAENTNLRDSAE